MSGHRILLVDDDAMILEVLPMILGAVGFRLTPANGGAEALSLLRSSPGTWDAAIIDLRMPPPDGTAVIREIASRPGCFGLRGIVLFTSEPRESPEFRALHDLSLAHPEIAQVVSHDPQQREAYLADGLLVEGLEVP